MPSDAVGSPRTRNAPCMGFLCHSVSQVHAIPVIPMGLNFCRIAFLVFNMPFPADMRQGGVRGTLKRSGFTLA